MDQGKTGRYIARLRRDAGLTQQALGWQLGVSNKTVSRWETGRYLPDIDLLRQLAQFFGVSMEELLAGERLPVPEGVAPDAAAAPTGRVAPGVAPGMAATALPSVNHPNDKDLGTGGVADRHGPAMAAPAAPSAAAPSAAFTLAERIAFWRRRWWRANWPWALGLALACLALLGLAVLAHRPWLVGAASLLGLAGQLWLHNRCMIYIEAHAYGPENER